MAAIPGLLGQSPQLLEQFLMDLLSSEKQRQGLLQGNASSILDELTSATRAPLPQPDAMQEGVGQLFGDVASIVSQKPEFAQRSREEIMQKRALMLQQRGENIELLKARYLDAANKVGKMDPIKEMEFREKAERLSKTWEQMSEQGIHSTDNASEERRTHETVEGAKEVARINSRAEMMRWLASGAGSADKASMTPEKRTEQITNLTKEFIDPKSKGIIKESRPLYLTSVAAVAPSKSMNEAQWTAEMIGTIQSTMRTKNIGAFGKELIRHYRTLHFPPPADTTDTESTGDEADLNAPAVDTTEAILSQLRGRSRNEVITWLQQHRDEVEDPMEILRLLFSAPQAGPRLGGFQGAR